MILYRAPTIARGSFSERANARVLNALLLRLEVILLLLLALLVIAVARSL